MRKLIFLGAIAFLSAPAFAQTPQPSASSAIVLPCPSSGSIYCPVAGSIAVSANPSTITVGGTSQLNAISFDTTNTQNINVTGQCVWTSSNTAVVKVGNGVATGVGPGSASLNCTIGGITATVPVSVTVVTIAIIQPTCGTPPCSLPGGVNGNAYSFTFLAAGGTAPYTWSITTGSFSACGVSLASTGVLSGTASTSTCNATVEATDSLGNTATVQVSLTIGSTACTGGPPNYPCTLTTIQQPGAFAPTVYPFTGQSSTCVPGPYPACGGNDGTIVLDPEPVSSGNNSGLFHNPIIRVTNAATSCGFPLGPGCPAANKSNISMQVDSGSADVYHWNTTSTRFCIVDTGQTVFFYEFNPSTMAVTPLYSSYGSTTLPNTGTMMLPGKICSYSPTLPYIFYAPSNSTGNLDGMILNKWDTTPTTGAPQPTPIYNFNSSPNCLPSSITSSTDPINVGVIGGVDAVFEDAWSTSGAQNTGRYIAAYKVGSGCSMVQFNSGSVPTVTGDWGSGSTGAVPLICANCQFSPLTISNISVSSSCNSFTHTCVGTITLSALAGVNVGDLLTVSGNSLACTPSGLSALTVSPSTLQVTAAFPVACGGLSGTGGTLNDTTPSPGTFTIHNTKISKNGLYAMIYVETCDTGSVCYNKSSPYYWTIGTANVSTNCPNSAGNLCSGHSTTGANNFYTQYATPYFSQHPLATQSPIVSIPASGTFACSSGSPDQHVGSQAMTDGLDDQILVGATTGSLNGTPNYSYCTQNEIFGLFPPASANSGQWKRFAHTYNTANGCFGSQNGISSVSQDGKWALFTSMMNGQLGCMNGAASGCTALTSCSLTTPSPRSDVFIVELQ